MGVRILRTELRRSVALWAALLLAAIGVFVLYTTNPPDESWMDLVIRQRDIMQLTWPLALGAGAWQGIRERRSRVEELLGTTPLPRLRRAMPVAAAMAIAAVAAHLVMLAAATGHLRNPAAYFPLGAIPLIAVGALAMVAAVCLGLAIGALLPSPLVAPLTVVVGFFALALLPVVLNPQGPGMPGRPGSYLLFPNLQVPRDGIPALQMLSTQANLAQALWLAALAATGLALLAVTRPAPRLAALLPAVLGASIAIPLMPDQLAAAWVENRQASELVCTSDEPRICIPRTHSHLLGELRGPAQQALTVLVAKLPPAPTSVLIQMLEYANDDSAPPDTLVLRLPLSAGDEAPDSLLARMLDGAGVPGCRILAGEEATVGLDDGSSEAASRYAAARRAAAAWLLDREPRPIGDGGEARAMELAGQALDALHALPADEQRARITALRDAERVCAEGDRLQLLTGTGRD